MTQRVMLSIQGRQCYQGQEPDTIRLVTEGTMAFRSGGWDITYQESELTGLEGVTTTFRVEPGVVTLKRTGKLNSQMVFRQGQRHDSLYQMEFGALMISVCPQQVLFDLTQEGGYIDLVYDIDVEQSTGGVIDYHLDIRAISE